MKNEKTDAREELALDALLAAAFRQPEETPPTQEEITAFLKSPKPLTAEAKAALRGLGPDAVHRFVLTRAQADTLGSEEAVSTELYAAMDRKHASSQHDPKTEEELARKRKEILERLKRKQGKDRK